MQLSKNQSNECNYTIINFFLITKGKIKKVEQRTKFLSKLKPKIKKLCVVKEYVNMEALLIIILEVEKVFRKLRETPHESLKEEQEKFMNEKIQQWRNGLEGT
jgi:hypothetical protein